MKQISIFILLLFLITCNSANQIVLQNNSNPILHKDWITFIPEKTSDFSESFKKKMTEELYSQLYSMLGEEIPEEEFEFRLWVGLDDLQMIEKDNNVFIITKLSTVFAKSFYLTVGWNSDDFTNHLEIHKSDITNKKVNFTWCNDFPKEEIIQSLKPTKILNKNQTGYKFDVLYYLNAFPDVSIYFDFIGTPTEESLNALNEEVKKYRDKYKTIFVHDLIKYKKDYIISINHNTIDYDTYIDKDYQNDINNLDNLLSSIDYNSKIPNLKRIRFR